MTAPGLVVDLFAGGGGAPQGELFAPARVELTGPVAAWCSAHGVAPVSIFNRPERGRLLLVAATWNRAWCVWVAEEGERAYRVCVQPWKLACTGEPGRAAGLFPTLSHALEFAAGYCNLADRSERWQGLARRLSAHLFRDEE